MLETKICAKCKVDKPLEEYHKHKREKDGLQSICKQCLKLYYLENREKAKQNSRQYNASNKDSIKQYHENNKERIGQAQKQWRSNNQKYIKQYSKQNYSGNKERLKKLSKQYYIDNPGHYKQYRADNAERIKRKQREWQKANPDKCNAIVQRRNAVKKDLPSTFDAEQWAICKAHFNSHCAYCGKELPLTQEHFVPLSKGGGYTADNIIPVCQSCNSSKSNKLFSEWYPKQKFYSKKRERLIYTYLNKENLGIQITII